jgi:hypothetical protein
MVNDVSMIRFLNIWDLVLTPIFLVLLINLAKRFRNRHYPEGHPLRRYYLPGLYVKFFGAIFIALVYEYYYGGGDTYNFFWHCRVINGSLSDSPSIWFKLIFHTPVVDDPKLYPYVSQMFFYEDKSSHATYAIAAVVGLLTGTNYIPTALIFAFLAYTGIWAMFRSFVGLRPHLHKQLAIAFLFIPSTFVWGSAIFKDTVCMFSLGWITYCTFGIFIRRDFSPRNILLLATSIFLIGLIKIYILMAFMPAIGLWLLMIYSKKIENVLVRWVVNLGFIALLGSVSLFFADRFSKELNEYSLENIAKKAKKTTDYISYISESTAGSTYSLGQFDPTITGMLSKFLPAVNVTLFRPYIWEANKPIIFLSALESVSLLVLSIIVFFRRGLFAVFRVIFTDPTLAFLFIYTLIFAFAVGISTGNFGALSRYKIPCMPFFSALLLILYYDKSAKQKSILHDEAEARSVHTVA